jgi:hypothetical protein
MYLLVPAGGFAPTTVFLRIGIRENRRKLSMVFLTFFIDYLAHAGSYSVLAGDLTVTPLFQFWLPALSTNGYTAHLFNVCLSAASPSFNKE